MSKPETLVIKRVRDAAYKELHDYAFDKTNNPYVSGILDLYVEGPRFAGHIEAKYRPTKYLPGKSIDTQAIVGMCSEHQKRRFKRHAMNRIPCALLCGFAGGGPRQRTYCFFRPSMDYPSCDLIWPEHTTVLSIEDLMFALRAWVNSYEICNRS